MNIQDISIEGLERRLLLSGLPFVAENITQGQVGSEPRDLTVLNGKVYFAASNAPRNTDELWETDGTRDGTTSIDSFKGSISMLRNANGVLYWTVDNSEPYDPPDFGLQFWNSDTWTAGESESDR